MSTATEAWIVVDSETDTDYEHDPSGAPFTQDTAKAFAASLDAAKTEDERASIPLRAERPMREVGAPTRGSGPVRCDDPDCCGHRERCLFGRMHSWATWFDNARLVRTSATIRCWECGGVCTAEEIYTKPAGVSS